MMLEREPSEHRPSETATHPEYVRFIQQYCMRHVVRDRNNELDTMLIWLDTHGVPNDFAQLHKCRLRGGLCFVAIKLCSVEISV